MSQLYVPVTLRNAREYVLAHMGHLRDDQVSTREEAAALIDTGALAVVLTEPVAQALRLYRFEETRATMANGLVVIGEVSEPVDIELHGRHVRLDAIILPTQGPDVPPVLLGAMVLEGLDLAVDCARGQLMPNLGTWNQPLFRV
jgi:predicted aspartyl protease